MSKYNTKTIAKFMGMKDYPGRLTDWNFVMQMVEKIEGIIEISITIESCVCIHWSYSPKKIGRFTKGAGGGGGRTVERTPFEPIFGKSHTIYCYYPKEKRDYKIKENEEAETKIDAVCLACFRWIEWYNKTVIK